MNKSAKELIYKLAGLEGAEGFPKGPAKDFKKHPAFGSDKSFESYMTRGTVTPTSLKPKVQKPPMLKNAQAELIQNLAGVKTAKEWLRRKAVGVQEFARNNPPREVAKRVGETVSMVGSALVPGKKPSAQERKDVNAARLRDDADGPNKTSSMRSIIDDIIKGAEQNTFGRPVNIQADTEFSPIDMAKVAGAVVALSEKGYSVKEASEYLGLTEKQVQDIVSTVG